MSEIAALETRVTVVEQEVEGEKVVSRYILAQTRRNGDDLAAVRSRQDHHDERFDRLEAEVRGVRADVNGLRRDLPKMMSDAIREVLRERDR